MEEEIEEKINNSEISIEEVSREAEMIEEACKELTFDSELVKGLKKNAKVWDMLENKVYPLALKIREKKKFLNRYEPFNEGERIIELLSLFADYHNLLYPCLRGDYITTLFWFGEQTWSLDDNERLERITSWIRNGLCLSKQTSIKLENKIPLENEEIDLLIWSFPYLYDEFPMEDIFPIALPNLFFGARYYWPIIRKMYIIEHRDDTLASYVDNFYRWYLQDQIHVLNKEDIEIIMEDRNFYEFREIFINETLKLDPYNYFSYNIRLLTDIEFMKKFYKFISENELEDLLLTPLKDVYIDNGIIDKRLLED